MASKTSAKKESGSAGTAAELESGLGPVPIFDTPEEAASAAKKDAEAAGISNKAAVMYSAPDGYGTGAD